MVRCGLEIVMKQIIITTRGAESHECWLDQFFRFPQKKMYFKFKGNFLKREDSSHQHQSSSNLPKKIKKNIRRSYTVSELNALKMQIIYIKAEG
jgi:hypothetical protein